ncbi:hypothetical protein Tco_0123217 [Tanacetum coccineum]
MTKIALDKLMMPLGFDMPPSSSCFYWSLFQYSRPTSDAIDIDFFLFVHGLYYAEYPEDGTLLVLMILAVSDGKGRLIEATPLVATTNYPFLNKIADYSACPLSALLELELDRLVRSTIIPAPNVAIVSLPSSKESTMTLASSSVEFFLKDGPPSFAATSEQPSQEHNEEWVNSMVDMEDKEMVDAASSKSVEVLMQGICHTPPRQKREARQERESSQHIVVYIEKLKHA